MMKLQNHILTFANGETGLFQIFSDYWNHFLTNENKTNGRILEYDKSISFEEKQNIVDQAIIDEVIRRSGINYATKDNVASWFSHPVAQHETFAVVGALIDSVLPQTVIDHIGMYTDIRVGGFGDSFAFDIEPRDIFTVSRSGRAQRKANVHKQFRGQVPVLPENHEITVGVSFYRVLSGKESLGRFVLKALQAITTQMTLDAYNVFKEAMDDLDSTANTGLRVSGWAQSTAVDLATRVSAWNNSRAIFMGTKSALVNVLPNDANYRYELESDFVKMGYVRQFAGFDVMMLDQVADYSTEFGVALADDRIWIISPNRDKPVKICLEGQMLSYVDGTFANADLSQDATMQKSWKAAIATNVIGGVITL